MQVQATLWVKAQKRNQRMLEVTFFQDSHYQVNLESNTTKIINNIKKCTSTFTSHHYIMERILSSCEFPPWKKLNFALSGIYFSLLGHGVLRGRRWFQLSIRLRSQQTEHCLSMPDLDKTGPAVIFWLTGGDFAWADPDEDHYRHIPASSTGQALVVGVALTGFSLKKLQQYVLNSYLTFFSTDGQHDSCRMSPLEEETGLVVLVVETLAAVVWPLNAVVAIDFSLTCLCFSSNARDRRVLGDSEAMREKYTTPKSHKITSCNQDFLLCHQSKCTKSVKHTLTAAVWNSMQCPNVAIPFIHVAPERFFEV